MHRIKKKKKEEERKKRNEKVRMITILDVL